VSFCRVQKSTKSHSQQALLVMFWTFWPLLHFHSLGTPFNALKIWSFYWRIFSAVGALCYLLFSCFGVFMLVRTRSRGSNYSEKSFRHGRVFPLTAPSSERVPCSSAIWRTDHPSYLNQVIEACDCGATLAVYLSMEPFYAPVLFLFLNFSNWRPGWAWNGCMALEISCW
jgi:hypothetical protein